MSQVTVSYSLGARSAGIVQVSPLTGKSLVSTGEGGAGTNAPQPMVLPQAMMNKTLLLNPTDEEVGAAF